jgi:indolepyruvate ferredoxin oxidoreductase beta subunit
VSGVTSVLLAGVGGQGVLLASEILAEAAAISGSDVKKSEVHGMAQRGGSVVSHLRFGPEVFSPLIPLGGADFLVSFEELETLRYLGHLRASAFVLVNRQRILPLPVSTGRLAYPADVPERITATGLRHLFVDGLALAREAGNERAVNAVVLGALSRALPFDAPVWEEALRRQIPARHLELNRRAFALGRQAAV